MLVLAGCGDGGDAAEGNSGADTTTTTSVPSTTAEPVQAGETNDTATAEPTTSPPDGSNESGGALSAALLADPPATTTTDERPDHTWRFHQAVGVVNAGGRTSEFYGVSPLAIPPGAYEEGATFIYDSAGCSFFGATDGLVVVQTSFTPLVRGSKSSFSMSDNADGTVTWGYFHAPTGEEWSATGPGRASIDFRQFGTTVDADERESILADLGFGEFAPGRQGVKTLLALITFEGEASENFSTDNSTASSTVLCLFAG